MARRRYSPRKKDVTQYDVNLANEEDMWADIVRSDPPQPQRISGNMIRKVGPHPGVINVSGGEQSSSPSEIPRTRR